MTRQRRVIVGSTILLIVVAVALLSSGLLRDRIRRVGLGQQSSILSPAAVVAGTQPYEQIDTTTLSPEQVRIEFQRRNASDGKWEWKIPILFFGKAIDENGQPVDGAEVDCQWTSFSAAGTSEVHLRTDSQGQFSLKDVRGKRLLVRVSKTGYYSSDLRNQTSFEYANPFEEIYHRPKTESPVLFYLRRKRPAAEAVFRSTEVILPGDGSVARVRLNTAKLDPDGELQVKAWKPWPPQPMSPAYNWKLVLNLRDGGFLEAPDQFAFEAPEAGYEPSYTIDMSASLGSQWKVSAERALYFSFGEPKKYGRLTLRTNGNSRYVFLDYVINDSGSRNLESGNPSQEKGR